MSFWISVSSYWVQSIIDRRYPRWYIRKVFDIIRFPIVDRSSFLQMGYLLSDLFLSFNNFVYNLKSLLAMLHQVAGMFVKCDLSNLLLSNSFFAQIRWTGLIAWVPKLLCTPRSAKLTYFIFLMWYVSFDIKCHLISNDADTKPSQDSTNCNLLPVIK